MPRQRLYLIEISGTVVVSFEYELDSVTSEIESTQRGPVDHLEVDATDRAKTTLLSVYRCCDRVFWVDEAKTVLCKGEPLRKG